jgi:hypothetical protein
VVLLRLTAPAGGDVAGVAAALRAELPPGFVLETVEPERPA